MYRQLHLLRFPPPSKSVTFTAPDRELHKLFEEARHVDDGGVTEATPGEEQPLSSPDDVAAVAASPSPLKPRRRRPEEISHDRQGHSIRSSLRSANKATVLLARSTSSSLGGRVLLAAGADPKNHNAAMADDAKGWTAAELAELSNHLRNGSWSLVPMSDVPANRRLVKMTWVYKRKRDGKMKARLCVQGCTQRVQVLTLIRLGAVL